MSNTNRHPLRTARIRLNLSQQQLADFTTLSVKTIERAERGESISGDSRQRLSAYFGVTAQQLGLVREEPEEIVEETFPPDELNLTVNPQEMQVTHPLAQASSYQVVDRIETREEDIPEQQFGLWMVHGAGDLAPLLDEGWSLESLVEVFRIVLKGVETMPHIFRQKLSRRNMLQIGAASVVSVIPFPSSKKPSAEERAQLHNALSENIGAGWKLFHTASTSQVLAVGYAQLYLTQHVSADLYPSLRPMCYSSVYNLIGAALDFQGRYGEAYQNHERAYVAALEGMDIWSMAQSRTCQANGLRAQHRYHEASETIGAALRLLSAQNTAESIRLKSHLLACAAENAALLGEANLVQEHLHASEGLLEQLPLTHEEEFDHASWHQYAGTCALILQQHDIAIKELERAVEQLPPQWLVRHATVLMPLAIAYARSRDRERCVEMVKKAGQVIQVINAASLKRQFVGYLEQEIQGWFPNDEGIESLISHVRQQMLLTGTSA